MIRFEVAIIRLYKAINTLLKQWLIKNKPNSKAYDFFTPYAQRKIILIMGKILNF